MVSPGKIVLALIAIVFAGIASYVVSATYFKPAAIQQTASIERPAPDQSKALVQASGFHAIVEPNGAVVLCVSNGEILLPDRCTGTGRLLIVQPIREGEVVWVSATGAIAMENVSPQNPDCALSRAKWDASSERTTPTGRKLRKIPPEAVVQQLRRIYADDADLMPMDVAVFGLDLDNDGREDIIYAADNVPRISKLNEQTEKPYRYFVQGGIFNGRLPEYPSTFLHETGEYLGGTDAILQVALKGIVPIAASSDVLAVLARTGTGLDGDQSLAWLGGGRLQRMASFEFRCN